MRFTSLDLEMTQPSGKIIQIGAVVFDTDRGEIARFNQYVDPGEPLNLEHELNIGITLGELLPAYFYTKWLLGRQASSVAMRAFWDWHRDQQAGKKWIVWGSGDTKQLLAESRGMDYPCHLRCLDLKQVYQFFWQPAARLQKQSGLGTACERMRVAPPSPAHDALNDALATGELFCEMFRQVKGVSELLDL